MPFIMINFSIADMIGSGSSVLIAIKIGEKDEKAANNIFSSAFLLIIILGFILGAIILIFAEPLLQLMGAERKVVEMAIPYLRVYAISSSSTTLVFAVDNYLRICGKLHYSMFLNILMSLLSAGLEIVFLVVFKMSIVGASLSRVIAMLICAIFAVIPFLRRKVQLRFTKPRFERKMLTGIFVNGSPAFLNNITGQITAIIINIFLLRIGGTLAVATYGVLMIADSLIVPILYGLSDSLQPAVGYNYGAQNYSRIWAIERRCFGVSGVLSIVMTAIVLLLNEPIVSIFVQAGDTRLITMASHALSWFAFAYLTRWISMATQSFVSAVEKPVYATVISLSLALVFPVSSLFVLSPLGLNGLWLNYPLTCLLGAVQSVIIFAIYYKRWRKGNSMKKAQ